MNITFQEEKNGSYIISVYDAGSIKKAVVRKDVKKGDEFEIHHGEGKIFMGSWLGSLKCSLKNTEVFKAEKTDPFDFYKSVSKKYNKCNCERPSIEDLSKNKLIALDLRFLEYAREEGRYAVYLNNCSNCKKAVTYGAILSIGCNKNEEEMKILAESLSPEIEKGEKINWDNVIKK